MGTAAPWVRLGVAATALEAADFWEADVAALEAAAAPEARPGTGDAEVGWSQRPSIRPTTWWVEGAVTGAPLCPRMTSWLKRKMSVSWVAARTGAGACALMAAGLRLMAR